jgi:hypothetical protein
MKRSTVLWRWRRNPLRGRSYTVESWALLALSAVALIGAALTGLAVVRGIDAGYAQQRRDRRTATAVLTENAVVPVIYAARPRTQVRWTLPGGAVRTGAARVSAGLNSGDRATIWLDDRGKPVAKPVSASAGRLEAAFTGTVAGLGVCAVALIGGSITTASLERRRIDRWGTEWARVGPRWNRRDA